MQNTTKHPNHLPLRAPCARKIPARAVKQFLHCVSGHFVSPSGKISRLHLPLNSHRISGGGTSIYLNTDLREMVTGSASIVPGVRREPRDIDGWVEYHVPAGWDTWEVAAAIANTPKYPNAYKMQLHDDLPNEIHLRWLPVSAALKTIYPNGFLPLNAEDINLISAHQEAEKDLKAISSQMPMSENLTRSVRTVLYYLHQSLAANNLGERLGPTLEIDCYDLNEDKDPTKEPTPADPLDYYTI